MNIRNGIPIIQPGQKKQAQGQLWKAESNPYKRYIEMTMTVDGCEASVIMPYKYKWVQKYKHEGWITKEVWVI
ncbi:hypothetical protein [Lysinibacillus fusiformis]|uniref:hypothetical protein n=1 Tax=Lysinibacillus fusiformis TaxID=28031 RepID=UPI000D35B3CC|nr:MULTISPECIES: hypothetical protein [Lysinibacillus]MED4668057.1 hypothetical protein [Lysinibacillus fusiformis]QAS58467.1 hypothetical protein LSP_20165 [Lysinibacillus sphaericus]RDV35535.1 hypothetical protein C7B90_02950 [Lysinibacillus fusiformis]GED64333.1 hypothetical protein LFU01_27850 [Lysinibacillus fusiformis]